MLRDATVLFLKKTKRGSWDPIGTGTLVFYNGNLRIVSAAHVFDFLGTGRIYIWAAEKIFFLGRFQRLLSDTRPFGGLRANDPIDLGVMPVPEHVFKHINGRVKFIQREFVENEDKSKHVIAYQAIGFPASKNRQQAEKAFAKDALFTPESLVASGEDVTEELLKNGKYNPVIHIAMRFRPKGNVDDDMNPIDAPGPHGMSGGLIQGCFDYIPHSNGFYPTCASAILIERSREIDALIGVRFAFVYAWMDHHADIIKELQSHIA